MIPIIVVAAVGLILAAWLAIADEYGDRISTFFVGLFVTAIFVLLTFGISEAIYSRASFAASTACMAKRQQAVRQALTANVVCVPAYRETKNDTTTVNLNTK